MPVAEGGAQPSSLEIVFDLARLLSELDRIRSEAQGAQEREADPVRKAAYAELGDDIGVRCVPVSMSFVRTCHSVAGADGPGIPDGPWPELGFRIARALDGFDPRIQGEDVAQARLRGALRDQSASP